MYPQQSSAYKVDVDFSLAGDFLTVHFAVHSDQTPHINPALSLGSSQWGLWDWDVVELFLSCDGNAGRTPYYEFQLSPLGQYLELEIFEPRKRFNRDFVSGFQHSVRRTAAGGWEAEMKLPLKLLGWDGNPASLVGNAFAILGSPAQRRTYWSLFLGQQEKPDFHLPQEFRSLLR